MGDSGLFGGRGDSGLGRGRGEALQGTGAAWGRGQPVGAELGSGLAEGAWYWSRSEPQFQEAGALSTRLRGQSCGTSTGRTPHLEARMLP